MFPRLFLFRKSDRLSSSLGPQKWHCSSGIGSLRINSSFATCAALGLTVFSLSTYYVLQNRQSKIQASPLVNEDQNTKAAKCPKWNFDWDHRTRSPNNSMRSYTLIRHGQYKHSVFESRKVLTDIGKQQATTTGQKLASLGIQYDEIICSTMIRAKQTADIITQQLYPNLTKQQMDIKYDANLNEGAPSYCVPERRDINESGFWDKLPDDSARISKAFETYIHRNDHEDDEQILVVGHGNVFRYFMCRVLQIPPEAWLRLSICNCGITKFKVFGDGRVSVECIGSDGHFVNELRTFN